MRNIENVEAGLKPGGGQFGNPRSPEIFKNMFSCWIQNQVTIVSCPPKISPSYGPSLEQCLTTFLVVIHRVLICKYMYAQVTIVFKKRNKIFDQLFRFKSLFVPTIFHLQLYNSRRFCNAPSKLTQKYVSCNGMSAADKDVSCTRQKFFIFYPWFCSFDVVLNV